MSKDYYSILGVTRDASADDIKRAYRKLAREHHPDVNGNGAEAEERFKELGEAYAVLGDPDKRHRYDTFGADGPADFGFPGGFDIFDIFNQAFGFATGGSRPTPGSDLQREVTIELEEVLTGASRKLELTRQVTCDTCRGSGAKPGAPPETCRTCAGQGRVRQMQNSFFGSMVTVVACPHCRGRGTIIKEFCDDCDGSGVVERTETLTVEVPPGIETGQHLEYQGYGDMGQSGYAGNLYIGITVAPHERFTRQGQDLHYTLSVQIWQVALGDKVTVPLIDGQTDLRLEPGTQSGAEITLTGKGLPALRRRGRGKQVIHIQVITPKNLSTQQREALENLARASGADLPEGESKGFFSRFR